MRERFSRVFLGLVIIFLFLLGAVSLGSSFLGFESVKQRIDAFTMDGKAEPLTFALFHEIALRLRFLGYLLLFLGGVFLIGRRRIEEIISKLLVSFIFLGKEVRRGLIEKLREEKVHFYVLFVIVIMGIIVRVSFLFQPMRYDEATTFINYASKPLWQLVSYFRDYSDFNNHIFHTIMVHYAYLIFGRDEWAIRLPALIFGILLVPASYAMIRIFYNKWAALLASAFVGTSSPLIEYSTNARGYTLVCLIFLVLLSLGGYLVKGNRDRDEVLSPKLPVSGEGRIGGWFLFVVLSGVGFYTMPIMLYPFGAVVIWLFLSIIREGWKARELFISLGFVILLALILYCPVIVVSGVDPFRYATDFAFGEFIIQVPVFFVSLWEQWNRDIPIVIRYFLGIGFFVALFLHKRVARHRIPIILGIVIWIIPLVMSQVAVLLKRAWAFLLPVYMGISCAGLSYILIPSGPGSRGSRYVPTIVAMLAFALVLGLSSNVLRRQSVYYSDETGTLREAEEITVFLKEQLRDGDRVYAPCPSTAPLIYYFDKHGVSREYVYGDLGSASRVFVIVNEPEQTIWRILRSLDSLGFRYNRQRLVRDYRFASVYELIGGNKIGE